MKPLSAWYYIKENKGRAIILIFMMMLTTFLFLAGNYIDSVYYYWDRAMEYSDKFCVVNGSSSDENYQEFEKIYEDLCEDEDLIVQTRSPRGFSGLDWVCTMGFEMGSPSMVFNSPEDMKKAFEVLGISCDFRDIKDNSVVMSSALAKQYALKKGDIVDEAVDKAIDGSYTLDAIIEDDSYILYYVSSYEGQVTRLNVMSRTSLSGDLLRDHISQIIGDRKGQTEPSIRIEIGKQFVPFKLIFISGIILLSIVLSVIVNSVLTGQFIRRTYEFGVYRAIGISRGRVYRKCAAEILLMDIIAIIIGAAIVLTISFLLNELKYIPEGKYLPYYSEIGLIGFAISNALVLIPSILLKGRSMARADVTEF